MKRTALFLLASIAPFGLAACSSESEEPVEQIVVREPGEAAPVAVTGSASTTDLVATGQAAFAVCVACHTAEQGGASSVGPNLHGVVGRAAGSIDGFGYSEALSGSGITWDSAELDTFLTDPNAKVPGTIMTAGSVGNAEKRAAIIAYLASLSE